MKVNLKVSSPNFIFQDGVKHGCKNEVLLGKKFVANNSGKREGQRRGSQAGTQKSEKRRTGKSHYEVEKKTNKKLMTDQA